MYGRFFLRDIGLKNSDLDSKGARAIASISSYGGHMELADIPMLTLKSFVLR